MKKLLISGIIGCLVMLIAPAAVIGAPAGPPGGLDVTIVNPLPVPVTGNVNATIQGDVEVINDEMNPVPVQDLRHDACKPKPLFIHEYTQGDPGQRYYRVNLINQVPKNQVLVIESVSVSVLLKDNILPAMVRVSVGAPLQFIYIPLIESPGLNFIDLNGIYPTWTNTINTRIYAAPGHSVSAELWTDNPIQTQFSGSFDVSISGTYIPADCYANE